MEHQPQFALASGPDQRTDVSPAEMHRAQVCSSHDLSVLMEAQDAHLGATAKRAGFKGLCASDRSLACSLGARNANEASWSQLADVAERIAKSTELPVLIDFDNAPILARELRQRVANASRSVTVVSELTPWRVPSRRRSLKSPASREQKNSGCRNIGSMMLRQES
ncbi:hypothetical protein FXV83_21390 [Bradyrhizobium hipponense]|uniref:Uncharacterized protein n=1 Tax=Bradyrhizobium hipponense TaxID=2605638 RepID=A0A5S4YLP5_9BRAD|nr:isocitrate lyase/phosphoenolpyruvate mutase family protein [Bradyrhizobium hipponense]TYO64554.1 hypothetical protein FXV83_21390 [Bradyrhizobium hipponense]